MDGTYDRIVGQNIHRQGAQKTLTPHVALRLMKVIIRTGGGRAAPKGRLKFRGAKALARPKAKAQPKANAQPKAKAQPKVIKRCRKTKAAAKPRRAAVLAAGRASPVRARRFQRGGGAPKGGKQLFQLGPLGPDP